MSKRFVLLLVVVMLALVACDPESDGTPVGTLVHKTQAPTQTPVPRPVYQSPSGDLVAGQTVYSFVEQEIGPGWCSPIFKRSDGLWETGQTEMIAVLVSDDMNNVVIASSGNAWFWGQEIVPSTKLLNREGVHISHDVGYIITNQISDFVSLGGDVTSITYQPYWGDEYIRVNSYSGGKLQISQWYQVFGTCSENLYFKMSGSPGSP